MASWSWWTTAADNKCTDDFQKRTSTYVVVLLSVVAYMSVTWGDRLLAAMRSVAVMGVLLTTNQAVRGRCTLPVVIGSFVAHLVPYAIHVWRAKLAVPWLNMAYSLALFLPFLCLYAVSGQWPYSWPPLVTVAGVIVTVLVAA